MNVTESAIRHDYARGFADSEDDAQHRAWEFDQWLISHDRKVWRQGHRAGINESITSLKADNPYGEES